MTTSAAEAARLKRLDARAPGAIQVVDKMGPFLFTHELVPHRFLFDDEDTVIKVGRVYRVLDDGEWERVT